MARSRLRLTIEAWIWRILYQIGLIFHKRTIPRPLAPSFYRSFPTTIATKKGRISLVFYTPSSYVIGEHRNKYPAVINFHGGGFVLGRATDDARWATTCVQELNAIVISVEYRMAPEYPFPTPVDDSADALLWVMKHAAEFDIDADRIALSGFSAGGNLCFTAPLLLEDIARREASMTGYSNDTEPLLSLKNRKFPRLAALVPFYPSTDYAQTRQERKKCNERPELNTPNILTDLFDESYLSPHNLDRKNPFLSPCYASTDMLRGLPRHILLYACKWDMLIAEQRRMRDLLVAQGSYVDFQEILARHGWDKHPIVPPDAIEWYRHACAELREIFTLSK